MATKPENYKNVNAFSVDSTEYYLLTRKPTGYKNLNSSQAVDTHKPETVYKTVACNEKFHGKPEAYKNGSTSECKYIGNDYPAPAQTKCPLF